MSATFFLRVKPLSVNECWKGRRYKTDIYRKYEKEVLLMLPNYKIPDGHLAIDITFGLSSSGGDWDNPIKPFMDILQKKYEFDDNRVYDAIVRKVIVKKGAEFVAFKIKPIEEKEHDGWGARPKMSIY